MPWKTYKEKEVSKCENAQRKLPRRVNENKVNCSVIYKGEIFNRVDYVGVLNIFKIRDFKDFFDIKA